MVVSAIWAGALPCVKALSKANEADILRSNCKSTTAVIVALMACE